MNKLILISVAFALCYLVYGERIQVGDDCPATGGVEGICQSLYTCPPLMAIVRNMNRTPQDTQDLRASQCGYDGNAPAVCCPKNATEQTERPIINTCTTPEGKRGQCINLYSCPAITDLLKPPVPQEKIQFVQQSKCNGADQYSVCCGPVPNFEQVQKGNCENRMTAFPPDPRTECCGVDNTAGDKIVGGAPTTIDQYPWLVLIEYLDNSGVVKTLCGGAIISGRYILTAGHCVAGKVLTLGNPTNVRLGDYDTKHEGPDCTPVEPSGEDCTGGAIRIPIEKTIPHPDYNPTSPLRRHDIALIRMAELAPFTDFIRPICLPSVDITQGINPFNATVAGWGAVSTRQSSSPVKLHVELPFVNKAVCQPAYAVGGRNVQLWKGQFCAGGQKGKDSCKGDSGGPFMFENGRTYEAIGVVSFGPVPCGLENIPGVYTNVFEYISWIRSTIVP